MTNRKGATRKNVRNNARKYEMEFQRSEDKISVKLREKESGNFVN